MSTVKANNYYDASGGSNAQLYGVASPPNSMGFRNRLINGDMRIDQRNAGASVNVTSAAQQFPLDRFQVQCATDGTLAAQRDTVVPTGFTNSLKITVSVADASLASTQIARIRHKIEGFNVADFGYGSASAVTTTLSFWVRSSVTGTFAGYLINSAANRSYPFTYTISSANTFEQKTVTIAGDTTGTWLTDNGVGIEVGFVLGAGSSYNGTAATWAAAEYYSVSGATNLLATSSATFYITGVQLEAGTVASPFERRDYGRELMMCQRYTLVLRASSAYAKFAISNATSGGGTLAVFQLPVSLRASPTVSVNAVSTTQSGGGQTNISSISGVIFIGNVIGVEAASATYTANQNVLWQDTGGGTATITMSSEL